MSLCKRWTRADLDQLDAQILADLQREHPASVRHVFYRQTDPTLPVHVEKTELGYRRVVRQVLKLRQGGRLPWGWVVDHTRRGYHVATYADGGEFLAAFAGLYRQDVWAAADVHVEVWCESRSIAAVLEGLCRELAVSLYPTGGFSSETLIHEAAEHHVRVIAGGQRVCVLYVGDHDPSGLLIGDCVAAGLREHVADLGGDPDAVGLERVAVTLEQIAAFDLPPKPRKAGERRRPDVTESVEAEAVPPSRLRALIRERVEAHLPASAWQAARLAEQSEREGLLMLAAGWR